MKRLTFGALVLFFFSLPWQDSVQLPFGSAVSVARITGLLLIVAALAEMLQGRRVSIRTPAVTLLLTTGFVLWSLISGLWSVATPLAVAITSLTYVQLGVMSVLVWQLCRSRREHLILLQAFLLGAYVLAGDVVVQYLTNPFIPNSMNSLARYSAFGANPNNTSAMMALALPIAWYLAVFKTKGVLRVINVAYIPIALFSVVLTGSRGGAVISLTGLLVVIFTFYRLNRLGKVGVLIFAALALTAVASLIPRANFERISETSSELSEGGVSNRGVIWAGGLELYREAPVFGIGLGSFPIRIEEVIGHSISPHNAFLRVLVEMGIFGFALYTLVFMIVLLPLFKLRDPDRAFYLVLWLTLLISMMPSNVEDAQYVWAFLILLATRKAYVLRISPKSHQPVGQLSPSAGQLPGT